MTRHGARTSEVVGGLVTALVGTTSCVERLPWDEMDQVRDSFERPPGYFVCRFGPLGKQGVLVGGGCIQNSANARTAFTPDFGRPVLRAGQTCPSRPRDGSSMTHERGIFLGVWPCSCDEKRPRRREQRKVENQKSRPPCRDEQRHQDDARACEAKLPGGHCSYSESEGDGADDSQPSPCRWSSRPLPCGLNDCESGDDERWSGGETALPE